MTHRRQKSPGSFQDELGGVIERIAPPKHDEAPNRDEPKRRPVKYTRNNGRRRSRL